MDEKRVAILIDADNTSYKYFETVINEAAKEGVITYKRIYGDWGNALLASYRDSLHKYSIKPIQSMTNIAGKNSTDITIVIEAMDMLYGSNVDVFCIVSSDSDFTALATRLREAGKRVVGMGRGTTPDSFKKACSQFVSIDKIAGSMGTTEAARITADEQTVETTVTDAETFAAETVGESAESDDRCDTDTVGDDGAGDEADIEKIRLAIENMLSEDDDGDGWMLLTAVTLRLKQLFPDLDPRNYGYKKMQPFVESIGFLTKSVRAGGRTTGPAAVYIHIK